jgi:hypothetical protein
LRGRDGGEDEDGFDLDGLVELGVDVVNIRRFGIVSEARAYRKMNQQFLISVTFQPSASLSTRVGTDDRLDPMRGRFVQASDVRAVQVRKEGFLYRKDH